KAPELWTQLLAGAALHPRVRLVDVWSAQPAACIGPIPERAGRRDYRNVGADIPPRPHSRRLQLLPAPTTCDQLPFRCRWRTGGWRRIVGAVVGAGRGPEASLGLVARHLQCRKLGGADAREQLLELRVRCYAPFWVGQRLQLVTQHPAATGQRRCICVDREPRTLPHARRSGGLRRRRASELCSAKRG